MKHGLLKLISTGHCSHPEATVIRGGRRQAIRFPSTVGVIEHAALGIMLFDTGYTERFFSATERLPYRIYRWLTPVRHQPGLSAISQLAAMGIAAENVRHIFISHFHADHIAGLRDFPQARFICARVGLDALMPLSPWRATKMGFLKSLLPDDFATRCDFLEDRPLISLPEALRPFQRGYDLAGDGSLLAVPLSGHHPGHVGLWCETNEGPAFLIGDACWLERSYRENIGPGMLAKIFLEDAAQFNDTIAQLAELHRRNPHVRIIPTHCPDTHRALLEQEK